MTLELDCDSADALLQICLNRQGFRAIHGFELASACASLSDPACPHHPEEACECRLVTLAVYRDDIGSIPLVLHGHGDETEICSVSSGPLPVALEHCLESARLDEQALEDRLYKLIASLAPVKVISLWKIGVGKTAHAGMRGMALGFRQANPYTWDDGVNG